MVAAAFRNSFLWFKLPPSQDWRGERLNIVSQTKITQHFKWSLARRIFSLASCALCGGGEASERRERRSQRWRLISCSVASGRFVTCVWRDRRRPGLRAEEHLRFLLISSSRAGGGLVSGVWRGRRRRELRPEGYLLRLRWFCCCCCNTWHGGRYCWRATGRKAHDYYTHIHTYTSLASEVPTYHHHDSQRNGLPVIFTLLGRWVKRVKRRWWKGWGVAGWCVVGTADASFWWVGRGRGIAPLSTSINQE